MKEREVVIGHRLGLHARAAAQLVQLSAKFRSTIVLVRADDAKPVEADARSILSILLLAARHGSTLQVRADGSDEDEALEKVCEYLSG
jgi:phosphocarrier protein HPr